MRVKFYHFVSSYLGNRDLKCAEDRPGSFLGEDCGIAAGAGEQWRYYRRTKRATGGIEEGKESEISGASIFNRGTKRTTGGFEEGKR